MDPLSWWLTLLLGGMGGAAVGVLFGSVFTRAAIEEEQADKQWREEVDTEWLNELIRNARE